jgi:hypothetical protein
MNDFSDSQARRMLVGAVLLGIAANALVAEGAAWRLGLSIWILIALLIAGWSVGIGSARDDSVAWPAVGGIGTLLVLGALSFVLRDAEALYALGFLSTLAAAALVAWRGRTATRPFARIRLTDLAVLPAQAVLSAALGAPLLAGHALRAGAGAEAGAKGRIGADTGLEAERGPAGVPRRTLTIVGAVIAVPVLFVLGALLVASDPVFEAVAVRWIDLPFEHALERAALIGFFTWVSAGWLRSFRRSIALPIPTPDLDALRPRAAFALLAPILYGVMLLLVLFLAIQARTLFGGAAYVELTSGLTYAQYAREGFVGLAAVAGIVLSLLVLGAWLVADSDGRDASRFRASGWTLVGLVLVMLASSAHRLMLYMSFFGLTDARLYAAAFTVAVAAALAWAGFTVLRGRRDAFAAGLLAVAASTVIVLHVINPERIVVQVNTARAVAGEAFDVEYHASLSADALVALGTAARVLAPAQCMSLVTAMHEVWTTRIARASEAGLGGWSLPRARVVEWLSVPAAERARLSCGSR